MAKLKPKACKSCRKTFEPYTSLQQACGLECAVSLQKKKREKVFKAETKRRKRALKTHSDYIQETQKAFNAYIRLRDEAANHPCITCGEHEAKPINGCMWDAGHFKSKQSHGHLRFNEFAAHREHSSCNRYTPRRGAVNRRDDMTHDQAYRAGLVGRIGEELVEWLEGPHPEVKYTEDELKFLTDYYKQKVKELTKEISHS
jgi:predicted RNA-binding Zn-ribbon protein involved in translation (DUF1610 family)